MALVFPFVRWTVDRVAKDMLTCSSGNCIPYSRCCGLRGQVLDLDVKLLRIVLQWCSQDLCYGEEKDLGEASRSLWVLLFKASLAPVHTNAFLEGVVSGSSSQESACKSSVFPSSSAFSQLST